MGRARRQRILTLLGNKCAKCDETRGLEIDHVVHLWLDPKDAEEDSNLQLLCEHHHREKTALDARVRAHTKRLIRSASPETRKAVRMRSGNSFPKGRPTNWPKTKLPSRPFANKPR